MINPKVGIFSNVAIRVRNVKTGNERIYRYSNRVTKLALKGIVRFIQGDFDSESNSRFKSTDNYTPKYLALGTNGYTESSNTIIGTGRAVTVEDIDLYNEIVTSDRVKITSRNISSYTNQEFVLLSTKTYVNSDQYVGSVIGEAGLFVYDRDKNNGKTCWARIAIDEPFVKQDDEAIDISWDITVSSLSNVEPTT